MRYYAITLTLLLALFTQSAAAQEAAAEPALAPAEGAETAEEFNAEEVLEKAHAWVLGFMVRNAKPGRKIWYEDGQETEEEALERYNDIAWDIVEMAYKEDTITPFKSTANGRSQLAAVWMGVMLHESSFMKHVDYNIGPHGRGDGGLSWCMMQLRLPKGVTIQWNHVQDRQVWWGDPEEEIFEGHTGPELIEDRKTCIKEGHKLVRLSFKSAEKAGLPFLEYLTAYTIGKSKVTNPDDPKDVQYVKEGKAKSRVRMGSGFKYFQETRYIRGFRDEDVTRALAERAENPDISFVSQAGVKGSDPEWKTSKPSPNASELPQIVAMPWPMPLTMPKPLGVREMRSLPQSYWLSVMPQSPESYPSPSERLQELQERLRNPPLGLMLQPNPNQLLIQPPPNPPWRQEPRMTRYP